MCRRLNDYICYQEVVNIYGAIFSGIDIRDYKMVCTSQTYDFPEEFELPTVRIKNQMMTGSCVAHALSSIELLRLYVIKQQFYIHVPYPFSAIKMSENGFAP